MLESPDGALVGQSRALEENPPSLALPGGGELRITKLHIDPPRLAPVDSGEVRVACSLWVEGALGTQRLLFHGPDELALRRQSAFGHWRLDPDLPRLRGLASALALRRPPAQVVAWAVGLEGPAEGEVREEYVKDASGRPVRAAARLIVRPSATPGKWSLTVK